ncbi:hypothetical protein PTKIN_Ptkin03bG0029300 [Pterospermum kingtungense]
MEELGSLWNYQENFEELELKLQYTTIELETVKMETNEEIRKYKEEVKCLLNLLKLVYQERDEARDQLQKLLNKLMPSTPAELQPLLLYPQSDCQILIAAKANSSITESNSLSDTYNNNHQSHGSSSPVTSPEFSSMNMAAAAGAAADSGANMGFVSKPQPYDASATSVIDKLAEGKALPQKGKLLEAVMEAGPLLQTLLVAGPLPRWRNPPTLTFKIPPVSIKGCEPETAKHIPSTTMARKRLNPSSCPEMMSRGSGQMCSAAMLNFAGSASASRLSCTGAGFDTQIAAGKRQRFH